MPEFQFPQLDEATRQHMLDEHDLDTKNGRLYIGKRLNQAGEGAYRQVLPNALATGEPRDIQDALEPVPGHLWIPFIIAKNNRQSTTPTSAAQTLAGGEFNRYYMRAICIRAQAEGDGTVQVVRGNQVANPRADRLVKVSEGDILNASEVLDDLRIHPGEDTELGMPRGPNSGLSLRFRPAAE